ncbi:MAG: bifunctional glutamate N-acetyltransferase/amino-acid acetyltransferase ArgJ [Deltaproteobacteria bacterium]|nr:bifunctional glutamate N-acetyltransferase/amino-acid acetyltransferase ArgJ [Deltaproteobacteria bacterium]
MSGTLPFVRGFEFSAVAAGIKKSGALDMGLIHCEASATSAAVFTQNLVRAAPVVVSEVRAKKGRCRAVLANSGNANACTGEDGVRDVETLTAAVARGIGDEPAGVLMASTGVIGERLPVDVMMRAVPELLLRRRADGAGDFARSIMTTDKFEKVAVAEGRVGRQDVRIVGCAKGAGMIAPNMATMLGFVWTDADVDNLFLREATAAATDATFNRIVVDGDTSTNDMVVVLASGRANGHGGSPLRESGRGGGAAFEELLRRVMMPLAKAIVKDGEGATHVVEIRVEGAASDKDARLIARRIAESPLVKTAFHGCDPNWGRLLAAAGRAGVPVRPDGMAIKVGGVAIVKRGVGLGKERESEAKAIMRGAEYVVEVDVGVGKGRAEVVTCDFSEEYVRINGSYRS